MALITLKGYVRDEYGVGISGIEVTAWAVNNDGSLGATAAQTAYSAATTGAWVLSNLNTSNSQTGMFAVREKNQSTGQIRWRMPDIRLMVGYLVGPHGEAPINDGAITAAKIATNAITNTKILNSAVTGTKIADSTISESKLDSTLRNKINSGGGSGGGLSAGSVQTTHLANKAVTNAKLDDSAVNADKLASGAVTNAKLGSSAVTGSKIANGTISESKLDTALKNKVNSSGGGGGSLNGFGLSTSINRTLSSSWTTVLSTSLNAGTYFIWWSGEMLTHNGGVGRYELFAGSTSMGGGESHASTGNLRSTISGGNRLITSTTRTVELKAMGTGSPAPSSSGATLMVLQIG